MLKARFHLSEAGKLHWLLGIEINQYNNDRDIGRDRDIDHDIDDNCISLSQGKYIDKVLHRFGMDNCKPHVIPISPCHGLRKWRDGDVAADQTLYQHIIGCLIYLVTCT